MVLVQVTNQGMIIGTSIIRNQHQTIDRLARMETIGGIKNVHIQKVIEMLRAVATTDAFLSMIVEVKASIITTCINDILQDQKIVIVLPGVTATRDTVTLGVNLTTEMIHKTIILELLVGHQTAVLTSRKSIEITGVGMLDIHPFETMTTVLETMTDQEIPSKVTKKVVTGSVKATMSDQTILVTEVATDYQRIGATSANEGATMTKVMIVSDTSIVTNTRNENAIFQKSVVNEVTVTAVSKVGGLIALVISF